MTEKQTLAIAWMQAHSLFLTHACTCTQILSERKSKSTQVHASSLYSAYCGWIFKLVLTRCNKKISRSTALTMSQFCTLTDRLVNLTIPVRSQVPPCWHGCSTQNGLLQTGPTKPSMQVQVKLFPVLESVGKTTNISQYITAVKSSFLAFLFSSSVSKWEPVSLSLWKAIKRGTRD